MRTRIFVSFITAASTLAMAASPASAGGAAISCYQPVIEPAAYGTRLETVVVEPAETVYDVVPARYGWAPRQVLVEPGGVAETVLPAEYRFVE